jgi:hypothetical protein
MSNLLVGRVRVFGRNRQLTWSFPPIPHLISSRMLSVTVLQRSRSVTTIRVDAEDIWRVKPPNERVPAGVREITIHRNSWLKNPPLSIRVTDATKVRAIVRWFDALPLYTGGGGYCPAMTFTGPPTVVDFRPANGRVLAQSRIVGAGLGGPCGPGIAFSIGGRAEPMLAGKFLQRVQALLGVPLTDSRI